MSLIILLILSEDDLFNKTVHETVSCSVGDSNKEGRFSPSAFVSESYFYASTLPAYVSASGICAIKGMQVKSEEGGA
jgi:hypothetical protein